MENQEHQEDVECQDLMDPKDPRVSLVTGVWLDHLDLRASLGI